MKVGILSDTHGSSGRSLIAVKHLLHAEAEILLHCGDIGSEQVLLDLVEPLHAAGVPMYAALGNVDLYAESIIQFPEETGIHVKRSHRMELGGLRIAVIHGDDGRDLAGTAGSGEFAYVFTGHTHAPDDRREGSTRVINPGAVYRAHEPQVAVLDLESGTLKRIPLGL